MNVAEILKKLGELRKQLALSLGFKTPSQRIYQTAVSFLGRDASPSDYAPDEFGCAETVCSVLQAAGVQIPMFTSTHMLYQHMMYSVAFQRIPTPIPGSIIISPTGQGNGKFPNGHTGICGENGLIMSNSSATGTFERNYNQETWKARYGTLGGFPIEYFISL